MTSENRLRFYGKFDPEYVDGRIWRLNNPARQWGFITEEGVPIAPKDGFITDFASVPRLLWRIFPPTGDGPSRAWGPAAVIHDWLYSQGQVVGATITRKWADNQFLSAMTATGVTQWVAKLLYFGVRVGGFAIWNSYRRERSAG